MPKLLRNLKLSSLLTLLIGLVVLLCALVAQSASFQVAKAAGTVTTCDEASLRAALTGGGTVTFACDGTISLSNTLQISTTTALVATGHQVTLDGGNQVGVLSVAQGVTLTLDNLTIAHGGSSNSVGGGILNLGGTLNITNTTFFSNTAITGAAIENDNGGKLNISNSTFISNTTNSGLNGGAIVNNPNGFANITGTTFLENKSYATGYAGGVTNFGIAIVNNSQFVNNSGTNGGAIHNDSSGVLTVTTTTFAGNSASSKGGAISDQNIAFITDSSFFSNTVTNTFGTSGVGGAISSEPQQSSLTIANSQFSHNSALVNGGGGGAISAEGRFKITNSSFSYNSSEYGGVLFSGLGYPLLISGSTFYSNTAIAKGGAIDDVFGSDFTIANSTFYGNSAGTNGGAINTEASGSFNNQNLHIYNVTLANNKATHGGAISSNNSWTTFANTILANNTGGTCDGFTITNSGSNLQWPDNTCAGITVADPRLGPFQDNGGPTMTLDLLSDSPAIQAGNNAICAGTAVNKVDQREVSRPQILGCDIGAVEKTFTSLTPLIVTNTLDAATNPPAGSLRAVVGSVPAGQNAIIQFDNALGNSPAITLSAPLVLPDRVSILADCAHPVQLKASFSNAVQLSGHNALRGITILTTSGPAIKATGTGNFLACTKAQIISGLRRF